MNLGQMRHVAEALATYRGFLALPRHLKQLGMLLSREHTADSLLEQQDASPHLVPAFPLDESSCANLQNLCRAISSLERRAEPPSSQR